MFGKVVLTGVALVVFGLTKFVFNTLVIRRFPATFLGEINQALSFFMLIPLFYAPVSGMVVSKFASEFLGANEPDKSRRVFSLSFVLVAATSAVSTVVALVFSGRISALLQVQPAILLCLTPMLALYSGYIFLRTSYYGFDRIALYLRNEIVSSLVFFGVLIAALLMHSQRLAVWPFAAQGVVFLGLAIYHLRDQFCFRAMYRGIAGDLRRCAHFFFYTIFNSMSGPGAFHLGIILTGRLTGNSEIAAYYSVLLYSLQPFNLLPISLASVMIPTISRHHGAGEIREGVAVAERAFPPLLLGMTLLWGCGTLLGWEAVQVISGASTGELIVAFEVVLFGLYLNMIFAPPSVLLNSTRHIAVIAWGGAAALVATLCVWWWGIPAYGLLGSAAGYGLLQAGKGAWAFLAARRILQWRGQFDRAALATISAIIALGVVSLASRSLWLHIALAALLVGIFFRLHGQAVGEYVKRLIAETRAHAPGAVRLSDSESG